MPNRDPKEIVAKANNSLGLESRLTKQRSTPNERTEPGQKQHDISATQIATNLRPLKSSQLEYIPFPFPRPQKSPLDEKIAECHIASFQRHHSKEPSLSGSRDEFFEYLEKKNMI
jgi:hypothetical protein